MKFDVSVFKTSQDKVTVEAESRDDAEAKVSEMFRSGEYTFPEEAEPYFDFDAEQAKEEKIKVVLLEPGKLARTVEIENSLESLQSVVGGYIEPGYYFDEPVCLICNDEGKINGMPLNRGVRDKDGKIIDIIAGTAFICDCSGENFGSLNEDQIKLYTKMFKYPEQFIRFNGEIRGYPIKPAKEEHER